MISVIITNYNYGVYLRDAVESVLKQTYDDFELIIVDDGSTDDSKQIIKEYENKSSRVRSVFLEEGAERRGQNAAFMEGVRIAKGEIICCLDADDWYGENMLAYKAQLHKEYPDCAMVDSSLSVDGVSRMVNARTDFDYAEALTKYGYIYAHNNTSGLSIQKEYLESFLPFTDTEEMKAGLDCILVHIALAESNIIVDKRICGGYRQHDLNVYSERKANQSGGFPEYIKRLKKYARKQVAKKGILIPDNDAGWYRYIIDQVSDRIHKKRVVVYGTSEIGKSVIRRLEELGETIVYVSDRQDTRRSYEANNVFMYPWIPAEELNDYGDKYDVIVIASRQVEPIKAYLKEKQIQDEKIVDLLL